ncbi:hypothetical protein [Cardiobacterium hominis]|uniref:hypothetical protein n=1 Tax=Cardiobacterium hominis TaxID=2718 RepID=UPI0028D4D8B5|nr:hypothetical protein [Cardiobacterium hominis]
MMRKLLPATLCLLLTTAQAQNRTETTFTYTTTAQRQNFQKHWQLSDQELARYEEVMINEGRFRYPKLTPVEILAITAKDDETMRYYAKKAAADEMRAVRAQLAYAVMVTEEKTKIYNELAEQAAERAAAREQAQAEKDEMQAKIDVYIAEHGGKDAANNAAGDDGSAAPAAAAGKTDGKK